jgi:O-Antigen ligase
VTGRNFDTPHRTGPAAAATPQPRARGIYLDGAASVPVGVTALLAFVLGWQGGSIRAADWLGEATFAVLVLATVLVAGMAHRPRPVAVVAVASLVCLAGWSGLSAVWAPSPALARDEGLLIALYAAVLGLGAVTLTNRAAVATAVGVIAGGGIVVAVAAALRLLGTDEPGAFFIFGRLSAPVGYSNAQSAFALVAFWPAIVFAARRELPPPARAFFGGGSAMLLGTWLMTQSKGGMIALICSAAVVFAFAPARLRLLVPLASSAAATLLVAPALLEPFRAHGTPAFAGAVEEAAGRLLLIAAATAAAMFVWSAVDRRVEVSRSVARAGGVVAVSLLGLGVVAGVAGAAVRVDDTRTFLRERWDEFKTRPADEQTSSHLLTLGSNRYDFWRVSLESFRDRPLRGAGARGFGAEYLREGSSPESPDRAHSVEMDLLGETGAVGFGLFLVAFVAVLFGGARAARRSLPAAGALGAVTYFLVHSSGDWIWTFPAVGILAFVLAGACVARPRPVLGRAPRLAAAGGALAVAVVAFAPPWVAARITDGAARGVVSPERLDAARTLDPLATDALVVESALAATPRDAVGPLAEAARIEPETARLHYLLGVAQLEAGDRIAARRALRRAAELAPRDPAIKAALARAGPGG